MQTVQIHSQAQRHVVNQLMLSAAQRLTCAIEQLSAEGYTVIKADFANPARPTVTVQNDERCHALIDSGTAAYYAFGKEDYFGPYRIGQFQCAGCRVIWAEFGH
ncbi:hypothetical protein OL229_09065 [Neisseriaceae bacterium JH1-16]|nr:hypothetical protein [Neisseriaceae bacterium JH1-16]